MYYLCEKYYKPVSLQSCPNLCDPMDCSPPGSSIRGVLQARILKWVAMPTFRGIFLPRDQIKSHPCCLRWQVGSLLLAPPGKPYYSTVLYSQLC